MSDLPLHLLDDNRLRYIACAYGNVYMLPILKNVKNQQCLRKFKSAHRYLVANITQFLQRSELWDPEQSKFER